MEFEILMDEEEYRVYKPWKEERDYLKARRGSYWVSPQGRIEIREKYHSDDGHPAKPLLDELERAENRRDYLEAVVPNLQAAIRRLEKSGE